MTIESGVAIRCAISCAIKFAEPMRSYRRMAMMPFLAEKKNVKHLDYRSTISLGLVSLLCALAAAPMTAADSSKYEIALLGQKIDPPAGVDRAMLENTFSRAAGDEKVHFLVQLYRAPDEARRNDLARRGIELGGYVDGHAFMAAVPKERIRSMAEASELRWAMPWTAERKLHPRVEKGQFGEWTRDRDRPDWVMLFVVLHHDVALERIDDIAGMAGGVAMPPVESMHGATVWVPQSRIGELAESEEVLWVEEGPMPLEPNNDLVRAATNADAVLAAPYGLDGTGVKLFVFDGGAVRTAHETFDAGAGSRVTAIDGSALSDHATHVAGTAAGDGSGSSGGRGRGIATGATLFSAGYQHVPGTTLFWDNAGDIEDDYVLARNTYKVDLGTNSIGSNAARNGYPCAIEGDYGVAANIIDKIVRGAGTEVNGSMILTWANGNERTGGTPKGRCGSNYATTGPPACAKNPIHVGAINSDGLSMTNFSSWGPCDDGRLKPTVVAPGCEQGRVHGETFVYSSLAGNNSQYGGTGYCGTSMATPAVAGVVSLFIEDWRSVLGTSKGWPLPALVKAFLIHTAKDLGQPGPDYIYGYGAVDAKAMIDTLRADANEALWGTEQVADGEVDNWRFRVAPGTAELRASLAWDDAVALIVGASPTVNDLTLQLIGPDGIVRNAFVLAPASPHSEAAIGLNTRDNQEQVIVQNPPAGTWTVRVTGTDVPLGPQKYGLVTSVKAAAYDPATCAAATAGFESGNDSFTLTGAARVAAPAAGHGAFSLRLGGTVSTTHEATRDFAIPATATRAVLTYHVFETTAESAASFGFGWDFLTAEVRDTAGNVLAVVDNRNDGWKTGVWMRQFEVDLTPWKGTTVRVAFRATNDGARTTTFWVDDLEVETCDP